MTSRFLLENGFQPEYPQLRHIHVKMFHSRYYYYLVATVIHIQSARSQICVQSIHKRMVRFQKLTRNLFLTLHGHNVHRQQRQLSEFLMRYQQFASHAYCGTAGPISKMASQQEKAFFVLRFKVSRSVITVQREFRARFLEKTHHAGIT